MSPFDHVNQAIDLLKGTLAKQASNPLVAPEHLAPLEQVIADLQSLPAKFGPLLAKPLPVPRVPSRDIGDPGDVIHSFTRAHPVPEPELVALIQSVLFEHESLMHPVHPSDDREIWEDLESDFDTGPR